MKLPQPASGYAIVGVAAVIGTSNGTISHAAIGVTGLHEHPFRAEDVEKALIGSDGSDAAIEAAAAHVNDDVEPSSDIHADGEYRAAMAVVYTRRAIEAALGR
jgi:carbon-monoxide dehydrogenase medium subunit